MNATVKQDDVEALKSEFESLRADVASFAESLKRFAEHSPAASGQTRDSSSHKDGNRKEDASSPDAARNEWEALRFASSGQWRPALWSLAGWVATGEGRAWLAPVLTRGLEVVYFDLGTLRRPAAEPSPAAGQAGKKDTASPETKTGAE